MKKDEEEEQFVKREIERDIVIYSKEKIINE